MATRTLTADYKLIVVTTLLLAIGLVMIYSSSSVVALRKMDNPNYYLLRQGEWLIVGIILFFMILAIRYNILSSPLIVWGYLILVWGLLLLTHILGGTVNGANRWLLGGSLQPSEMAKLALIIYLSYLFNAMENKKKDRNAVCAGALIVTGLSCLLIVLQRDIGTPVILVLILLIFLFLGGFSMKYILSLVGVAGIGFTPLLLMHPYRIERILTILNPERDPLNTGFQIRQSLIAIGSGGITGKWLMGGSQKFLYLISPHTDFIYSIICEELGFIGAIGVVGLFIYFFICGMNASIASPDTFGKYLGIGITSWIVIQALINMAVAVSLLPTKGLPLPLISYGGSSLVVTMSGIALLINISMYRDTGGQRIRVVE